MKNLARLFVVALAVTVLLSACSKQPTQEISDSNAVIDSIVAEGGEKYAKDELRQLNDSLQAAMDEVKTQDGKFFKNYDRAKEMLVQVKTDAESLKAEIPAKKQAAHDAALVDLEAANTSVAEVKALIGKAPRGKGSMADIEALKADIAGLEQSMPEVQTLIDSEDYLAASEKAQAVKTKAADVSAQINAALEKVGKK